MLYSCKYLREGANESFKIGNQKTLEKRHATSTTRNNAWASLRATKTYLFIVRQIEVKTSIESVSWLSRSLLPLAVVLRGISRISRTNA